MYFVFFVILLLKFSISGIFHKSVTKSITDGWTDIPSFRDTRTHLKMPEAISSSFYIVWSIIAPTHNQTKNTGIENHCKQSVLLGWSGWSKNRFSHFTRSPFFFHQKNVVFITFQKAEFSYHPYVNVLFQHYTLKF